MLGHTFYHELINKYAAAFGTLFNDVKIQKKNRLGQVIKTIDVPLTYSNRDSFVARILSDPEAKQHVALTSLPIITYSMTNFSYNPGRMTPPINLHTGLDRPEKVNTVHEMIPYDFNFQINIFAETVDDALRIVEQIAPFFVPQFVPTVELLSDPVVRRDIPIIHIGSSVSDTFDGSYEDRRGIIYTMDFVLQGELIGPVIEKPLILVANTNIRIDTFSEDIGSSSDYVYETVSITPGQYANGDAFSNTGAFANTPSGNVSVSANTIYPNSEYGYIISYEYNIE